VTGLPWWFHLAQKARRSETARRPCPGHDISQVLEKRGLVPLFSLAPVSCVIPGASKGKSPVAGLFARHLALSNALSNTEPSAHPSCRTAVCSPDHAARQTMRLRRSVQAQPPIRGRPDNLMTRVFMVVLHSSECVKAEEREGVVRSAAAPSRGSAVTQVFLAIARHLPVMMRAGRSGNAGQCSHGKSKRQYDFGRHVHLLLPGWLRNR